MSIHNLFKKINPLELWTLIPEKIRMDMLYIMLLCIVGALSFGLGRLSLVFNENKPSAVQIQIPASTSTSTEKLPSQGAVVSESIPTDTKTPVVASSQGTKWHYAHCPGAKTISPKNKITFQSAELAEKAGYTRAANCK